MPQFISVNWGVLTQLQWSWGLGRRGSMWEDAVCLNCYMMVYVTCGVSTGESI